MGYKKDELRICRTDAENSWQNSGTNNSKIYHFKMFHHFMIFQFAFTVESF